VQIRSANPLMEMKPDLRYIDQRIATGRKTTSRQSLRDRRKESLFSICGGRSYKC